jgi:hypothetical protein
LLEKARSKNPITQLGQHRRMATVFLAHDGDRINGETLYTDGGYHVID